MSRFALIVAGVAGSLAGVALTSSAWPQSAPKTCSDAYHQCRTQTGLQKECETERQWCMQTGSFADPKTKTVSMDLKKK